MEAPPRPILEQIEHLMAQRKECNPEQRALLLESSAVEDQLELLITENNRLAIQVAEARSEVESPSCGASASLVQLESELAAGAAELEALSQMNCRRNLAIDSLDKQHTEYGTAEEEQRQAVLQVTDELAHMKSHLRECRAQLTREEWTAAGEAARARLTVAAAGEAQRRWNMAEINLDGGDWDHDKPWEQIGLSKTLVQAASKSAVLERLGWTAVEEQEPGRLVVSFRGSALRGGGSKDVSTTWEEEVEEIWKEDETSVKTTAKNLEEGENMENEKEPGEKEEQEQEVVSIEGKTKNTDPTALRRDLERSEETRWWGSATLPRPVEQNRSERYRREMTNYTIRMFLNHSDGRIECQVEPHDADLLGMINKALTDQSLICNDNSSTTNPNGEYSYRGVKRRIPSIEVVDEVKKALSWHLLPQLESRV